MTKDSPLPARRLIRTIVEVFLVSLVGIFSDQIAEALKISPILLVVLLVVVIASLVAVRIPGLPYQISLPYSKREGENTHERQSRKRAKDENTFPLGLIGGIVLTVPTFFLVRVIQDTNQITIYNAYPYEIASAVIGFTLCGYAQLSGRTKSPVALALGMGLGQAVAVMILAPQENTLLPTLLFTPLVYLTFSILIRAGPGRWINLLALPAFLIIIFIGPYAFFTVMNSAHRAFEPSPDPSRLFHNGEATFYSEGSHQVFYRTPFRAPPSLEVRLNGMNRDSVRFRITDQKNDHFTVDITKSNRYPVEIWYEAEGRSPVDSSHSSSVEQ
jgi:hypothetical protein